MDFVLRQRHPRFNLKRGISNIHALRHSGSLSEKARSPHQVSTVIGQAPPPGIVAGVEFIRGRNT
jgi:hypothetical protein